MPCASRTEAYAREAEMIRTYQPPLNRLGVDA